jgi:hypothetical protein
MSRNEQLKSHASLLRPVSLHSAIFAAISSANFVFWRMWRSGWVINAQIQIQIGYRYRYRSDANVLSSTYKVANGSCMWLYTHSFTYI